MNSLIVRVSVALATSLLAASVQLALPAAAAPATDPVVVHAGVVTRQDVRPRGGCENDTVVEPDVAVSPTNPNVAIAAAHDCRFSDGGAVDISIARTADGGANWHHGPVRGVTKAAGGRFDRASDPVVTFGADGVAYLSILAFDIAPCPNSPSAILVLTSRDGGQTWSRPHVAQYSATCRVEDDKNWIVVDNSPASPHFGRVYQFWTPFLSKTADGTQPVGSPQALRWSDDHGRTWSATVLLNPRTANTQNSQPMIEADGTIVDAYYDFGSGGAPDVVGVHGHRYSAAADARGPAVVFNSGPVFVARSADGGASWNTVAEVTNDAGGYAQDVRCCLFAADIDPVTGDMYVAFEGAGVAENTDPVFVAVSHDGFNWTNPVQVSRGDTAGVQRVNVDVVAHNGSVYVAYGTRTHASDFGGIVQQQLSVSRNRGATFAAPTSVGPVSRLRYAARAGGYFPGDYIGEALSHGHLYAVWAVSSKPPVTSTSPYHQVIWGATLRTG